MAENDTLPVGTVVDGRYEVLGVIGSGGMAIVYRVRHLGLNKDCAMKVLNPGLSIHRLAREGFFREARVISRIRHPNIVEVYDAHDNGMGYIVMELIEGKSARALMKDGPMTPEMALAIVEGALAGLHAGHEHNPPIIHRDMKPDNVIVSVVNGVVTRVVVIDYGIAHYREEERDVSESQIEMTNVRMGSEPYCSPEQRAGHESVDRRTDVFGAGATLWALLTGRVPANIAFMGQAPEMLNGIPEPCAEVIRNAVEYRMTDRYATAEEMRLAVVAAREKLRAATEPPKEAPSGPFSGRTVNVRAFAVLGGVVAFIMAGALFMRPPHDAPVSTPEVPTESVVTPKPVETPAAPTPPTVMEAPQPAAPPPKVTEVATTPPTPKVVTPPRVATVKTTTPTEKPRPAAPTPTPPTVAVTEPVAAPDPSPLLVHAPVTSAAKNSDVTITARVKNVDVSKMWLYWRQAGTTKWESTAMRLSGDSYRAGLHVGETAMEYYVDVVPNDENVVVKGDGNRRAFHTVTVTP